MIKQMTYRELKNLIQKRYNDFLNDYAFWAFDKETFDEEAKKLNVSSTNKVVRITGGGFLLSSKLEDFRKLEKECKELEREYKKDMRQLKQMIKYELSNHEYFVREDISETLEACSITEEEASRPDMKKLIEECKQEYMKAVKW